MSVWTRWAAAQRAARGLSAEQAHLLGVMAGEVQAVETGAVVCSVRRLAELHGKPVRTTERRLAQLERLGLFTTERSGSQVARRLLNHGAVPELAEQRPAGQLDVFSTGPNNGRLAAAIGVADRGGSATLADGGSAIQGVADKTRHPRSGGGCSLPTNKEGEGGARESDVGFTDTYDPVVAVLQASPVVLVINPTKLNRVLVEQPESAGYEHETAARQVVEWMTEGGMEQNLAHRLIAAALRRQAETPPHAAQAPTRQRRRTSDLMPRSRAGRTAAAPAKEPAAAPEIPADLQEPWVRIGAELERTVGAAAFSTYFAGLRPTVLDDERLRLGGPAGLVPWTRSRYGRVIEATVSAVLGRPVEVVIEAYEEAVA